MRRLCFDQLFVAQQIVDFVVAGICARSVIATNALIVATRGAIASISGRNVRSKNRIWSSASGDPDHLIRMQPRIHRVQTLPDRDRVVQLHMTVAVPRSVAMRSPCLIPRAASALAMRRALRKLSISRAMNIAFDAARDDFLLTVMAFSVGEQRRYQQWLLHHQSVHIASNRVQKLGRLGD